MALSDDLHHKLDALYAHWQALTPDSPEDDFAAFASFFDENCTAWLLSMRDFDTPSIGRAGVITGIKAALKDSQIRERRVIDRSSTGRKVFCETSNVLTVYGKIVDPFPETTVAVFGEGGLVLDFKIYSCRSKVVALVQDATGAGPYKRAEVEVACHCE
ncbi:Uu.00g033650.m01.CDS01 [Anthostomella pinea]|uniref:Uu.00g033650.m01.CDS01 n=1 Tax=Anthostomella pinea TaxID=933095 RepID=A0AAI8V9E5_9PEZI|nr:Uu.00g033650.m01.CDS01 [Anthostomella pinea]